MTNEQKAQMYNQMMFEYTKLQNQVSSIKGEAIDLNQKQLNEIREIENGHADKENNLLKNAPHTADCIINKNWTYPYSPQEAVYPVPYLKENKYWVPVRRVDNAFGDRNLICSCPSIESYANLKE